MAIEIFNSSLQKLLNARVFFCACEKNVYICACLTLNRFVMKDKRNEKRVVRVNYVVDCNNEDNSVVLTCSYRFDDETTENRSQLFNLQVIPFDVAMTICSQVMNGSLYAKK